MAMKRPNPADIQITKDFQLVLDNFVRLLYIELANKPVNSEKELHEVVYQVIEHVLYPVDLSSALLKYKEPKMQFTKSGPLGKTSYAAPIERQDYARRLPSKPFKQTPSRQLQQSRMQQAVSAWKSTGADIQAEWNQASKEFNFAGVQLFHGVYLALLIDDKPIPTPCLPTVEILQYYRSRPKK